MIKELNYDLTKEDFKNFAKDCVNAKQYKKQRWIQSCIVGIIYLLIMSIIFLLENNISSITLLLLIGGTLLLIASIYFTYPNILQQGMKRFSKGLDYSNNIMVIDNDSEFFKGSNNRAKTEFKWSQVKYIYNFKFNILIFIQEYQAIIIPKRIFESEQEMNETWELIQECYNKYKEDSSGKSPQNAEK